MYLSSVCMSSRIKTTYFIYFLLIYYGVFCMPFLDILCVFQGGQGIIRNKMSYSIPSVARTLMARLPRLFRTRSCIPSKN